MFSLWDESFIFKNSIFKDEPSPAKSEKSIFTFLNHISQIQNHIYISPIEKTPKLTPVCLFIKGSMAVEASILIPILLLFVMHIFSVVEMIRVHSNITYGLWRVGEILTIGESVVGELVGQEDVSLEIPGNVVGGVALSGYMQNTLGNQYLEGSPLIHGAKGLNFLMSDYRNEEECVDIVVTYQVEPPITIFPFPYTRMANRYYAKAFTGFDVTKGDDLVYVAEHGAVWHVSAECSYIHVPVTVMDRQTVMDMDTEEGGKYKPCDKCGEEEAILVYITKNGEKYHASRDCPSLRRHVRAVPKKDATGLKPCSRCVKEEK